MMRGTRQMSNHAALVLVITKLMSEYFDYIDILPDAALTRRLADLILETHGDEAKHLPIKVEQTLLDFYEME